MNAIQKELTKSDILDLAEEAREECKETLATKYEHLYPIFDVFEDRRKCFEYLVGKEILRDDQFASYQTYWYKSRKTRDIRNSNLSKAASHPEE